MSRRELMRSARSSTRNHAIEHTRERRITALDNTRSRGSTIDLDVSLVHTSAVALPSVGDRAARRSVCVACAP
jgi:hypothetical protein